MTSFLAGEINGTMLPARPGQAFRFLSSTIGDIFVSPRLIQGIEAKLFDGAELKVVYQTAEKGIAATKILSIESPPVPVPEVSYSGSLKFFNEDKGFGFIICDDFKRDIFLSGKVRLAAGLTLEKGMALNFAATSHEDGRLRATRIWLEAPAESKIEDAAADRLTELPLAPPLDEVRPKKPRIKNLQLPPSLAVDSQFLKSSIGV